MIKMSPEGMVLEVVDSDSSPLFAVGSSNPTPLLMELLTSISGSLGTFQNDLKIVGHTDSLQYRQDNGYDNWNLSTDRANTIRRLLLSQGLMPSRLREVSGRADTDPLAPDNPSASQNRRISIVILTDASKDELRLSAY
jgi:chemotaxis protein MotB